MSYPAADGRLERPGSQSVVPGRPVWPHAARLDRRDGSQKGRRQRGSAARGRAPGTPRGSGAQRAEGNDRGVQAAQSPAPPRIPRGEGGSHPSGQAGLAKDTEAGRGTWQGPPCVSICLEAPARRPHERFWQEPSGRNWHSHLQSSASPAACAVRARVYDTTVQREPRSQLGPRRESAPDQVAAALSTLSGATPGIPGWVGQPGVPVGR
jgi:hypothetical protein